jgi:hypothetical protein
MDDDSIKNFVQTAINTNKEEISELLVEIDSFDNIQQYKIFTAYRFLLSLNKYRKFIINKNDFEVSLRNYLLVMNTDVMIKGFDITPNNEFG